MGFKKKVFGIIAAAALTLSMGAGIASANGNADFELKDASCELVPSTSSFEFGVWNWSGTQWVLDSNSSRVSNLNFSVVAPWNGECHATLDVSGFASNSYSVDGKNFNYRMVGTSQWMTFWTTSGGTTNAGITGLQSGNHTLQLRLNQPDAETAGPGDYEGTITFGLASGQ